MYKQVTQIALITNKVLNKSGFQYYAVTCGASVVRYNIVDLQLVWQNGSYSLNLNAIMLT